MAAVHSGMICMKSTRSFHRHKPLTESLGASESASELANERSGARKQSYWFERGRRRIAVEQVIQSSAKRCVLERTCIICTIDCIFTFTFVPVRLKCISNCLTFTFHTLTYLHFAQQRRISEISTRLWRTDGRTDGRTGTPSYRDARTHLKTFFLIMIYVADMAILMSNFDNFDNDQIFSKFARR